MGTNQLEQRATGQTVQANDVNQYYTALTDALVPRVLGTGLPLTNYGSIGTETYKWASGHFHGNVDAGSLSINGVSVGTSSDSYWILDVDDNISYTAGDVECIDLVATNLTGTLQTASQPNVTSVGTLTSLTSSGKIETTNTDADSIKTAGGVTIESVLNYTGTYLDINDNGTNNANKTRIDDFSGGSANSGARLTLFDSGGTGDTVIRSGATDTSTFAGKLQVDDTSADAIYSKGGIKADGVLTVGSKASGLSQVFCEAIKNNSQTISSATPTTIIFNTEVEDTDSINNTSTGVFTVPDTGRYIVHVNLGWATSNSTGYRKTSILVNSEATDRATSVQSASADFAFVSHSDTFILNLEAGDTFVVKATQNSGGDMDTAGGNDREDLTSIRVMKMW